MLDLHPRHNDASFLLDLLRVIAAQLVCAFHAIGFLKVPWLRTSSTGLPPLQNLGVCVFFLLSGFLIAHTLRLKSQSATYGFRDYATDRFARIYSGWIPALIFVAVVDFALAAAGVYDPARSRTASTFLGNVAMLQGYRGAFGEFLSFPMFGSGGPFWTLSIEFHLYIFAGALFFLFRGRSHPWLLLAAAVAFGQLPLGYSMGLPALTLLWVAGFAAAILLAAYPRSPPPRVWAAIALGSTAVYGYQVGYLRGDPFAVENYPALIVWFISMTALALNSHVVVRAQNSRIPAVVRFLADYSFTLYLTHFTVLYALSKYVPHGRLRWTLFGVLLSNLVAVAIALPTEFRHRRLAAWLKSWRGSVPHAQPSEHRHLIPDAVTKT